MSHFQKKAQFNHKSSKMVHRLPTFGILYNYSWFVNEFFFFFYRTSCDVSQYFNFLVLPKFLSWSADVKKHESWRNNTNHRWYKPKIHTGYPNQNLLIQMAITLTTCIFDLMVVKSECAWEATKFENCKQTAPKMTKV